MEAMKNNPLPSTLLEADKVSFRDPSGSLYLTSDKVVRLVNQRGLGDLSFTLNCGKFQKHVERGNIISTRNIAKTESTQTLEHPRLFFPTYPEEWVPEMLNDAGSLTLQLAEDLLSEDLGLKDATPRNILFNGSKPVFIDLLSFEKRHPNDATWKPFEQYCRSFLYPLVAKRALGISLQQTFASNSHGPKPEELLHQLHPLQRFHPRYFSLVTIPAILAKWTAKAKAKGAYNRFTSSKAEAQFVLKILLKHLRKGLERVAPSLVSESHWKSYVDKNCPYSAEELETKKNGIERFLKQVPCKTVLDLGSNTGTFSVLAAKLGKKVVAVDGDAASVSYLYAQAKKEQLDILPVHMDLLNPTPAKGWNGKETRSFLDRSTNTFDTVFMLALIHHLMGDGISLEEIFKLAARVTTKFAIMEYIPPSDQNFKNIIARRGDSVPQPSQQDFESNAALHFTTIKKEVVSNSGRTLYYFEKRA